MRNNDRLGPVNFIAANVIVVPVRIQKKLHRPPSQTTQYFLNCRICCRLRVIHQQITVGARARYHVKRGLWRANLNNSNVAAYRNDLGLRLRKVRFALLEPLECKNWRAQK